MIFNGMPLIENRALTKGIKSLPKRRNKSKRIQKKWNKIYGFNYIPIPDTQIYIFDGKIIGHPKVIAKIIKAMDKR